MRKTLPFAILSLAIAGDASAVPTSTGAFNASLPGTTYGAQPELGGTVINDSVVSLQSGDGTIKATIQLRVSKGSDGTLTFSWRLTNTANSRAAITGLTLQGFPNDVYDANWRVDGLGTVAPSTLSGDGASAYSYTWTLASPLPPGKDTRFFFLKTSATSFITTSATIRAFNQTAVTNDVATPSPTFGLPVPVLVK